MATSSEKEAGKKYGRKSFPKSTDGFSPQQAKALQQHKVGDDAFLDLLLLKQGGAKPTPPEVIPVGLIEPKDRCCGELLIQNYPNSMFSNAFFSKDCCYITPQHRLRRNVFIGSVTNDGKRGHSPPKAHHFVHIISTTGNAFGDKMRIRYQDLEFVILALQNLKTDIESTFKKDDEVEIEDEEEEGMDSSNVAKIPKH